MKRKKYNIHPDFNAWANFHPPINKAAIKISQTLLDLLYLSENSDESVIVEKLKIPFKAKDMRAIFYTPKNLTTPAPCLVYFHGGGFVLPASPYHYQLCKQYAQKANCKVLFVDYPLAPKYSHPVPMYACFEAYKWALENAEAFGIDKSKIAVGGDSAGGSFASIISVLANENQISQPCGELLIYPAFFTEEPTPSMQEFTDTPLCNSRDCQKYQKYYFPTEEAQNDRYVSALEKEDVSFFPPAYIETAEFDCLRDGAILFAKKLKETNIDCTLNQTKQTIHGYDMVMSSSITKQSVQQRIDFLKKVFEQQQP